MHLFLTDRLSCPRCGPEFGLILLADDVQGQRVLEGRMGCSNCREQYPVEFGFGDFRLPPRPPLPNPEDDSVQGTDSAFSTGPAAGKPDPEEALRMAALLGVTEGPGTLLLQGPAAWISPAVAELIDGIEVVAVHGSLVALEESVGVSRLVCGSRLPFFSGTFLGVLLSGSVSRGDVEEGARVLGPSGHLVVTEAPPEAVEWVEGLGMRILLEEERALVAQQRASGSLPLVTLRGT